MSTARPERSEPSSHDELVPSTQEDVEAWRDLQAVLEERDREWWADAEQDDPDE